MTINNNDINNDYKYAVDKNLPPIFKLNNWCDLNKTVYEKTYRSTSNVLNKIQDKGCGIWLNPNGDICYRLFPDGDIIISSWKKIGFVFHNLCELDIEVKRCNYNENPPNENNPKYTIFIHKLVMIQKEVFNPTQKAEFFDIGKRYYKNTFKPTNFLLNEIKCGHQLKYSVILCYIYHLANYNKKRFYYIINWLANIFNNLTKLNIALVLIGNKESGIDMLFKDIIKPLFGSQYCIEIEDADLQNKHYDKLFNNKLFYNFNEISHDVVDKKIKNICQEIIENNILSIEQNHKSTFQEINIFAQTLITTSKPYIPIIDTDRLNFTVFNVNGSINKIEMKDEYKNISLHQNIKDDLTNFSIFLRNFEIDNESANRPFKEDDSNMMLDYDKNIYEVFIESIRNKDKEYFKEIKSNSNLYKELLYDFDRDRVKRVNIFKYFSIIYPEESLGHTRTLLKKLREIDDKLFSHNNINSSNSEQYFKIL